MPGSLNPNKLRRWRRDPVAFIREVLVDPETGEPFELYAAEECFIREALTPSCDGRLPYPEILFGAPKKSGKTALAAIATIYVVLVMGGPYAEGYCVANDFEQAQGRVFRAIGRIIEASPLLRSSAKIGMNKIEFPSTGASIVAISSDYASAAGANPTITVFDELWGYTSESAQRLWDEMIPVPTRKVSVRLTVTYAGFEGESELLEGLYKRGLAGEQIAPSLYRQPGLLMAWHHEPIAPWQTEAWLSQMRAQLRPSAFLRMIENRFVSSESTFIPLEWWDRCTDPERRPLWSDPYSCADCGIVPAEELRELSRRCPFCGNLAYPANLGIWLGIDASIKRDSTAIVACASEPGAHIVRVINHRIFQPTPDDPLDFENTIERTVLEWSGRYRIAGVLFDPFQMISSAQRLSAAGISMIPMDQTVPQLVEASSNLYELLKAGNLRAYPDDDLRKAIGWCVAKETPRGFRIVKEKTSHKIDPAIALAMAALGAVKFGPSWTQWNEPSEPSWNLEGVYQR